jgi:hypothetical protein
MHMCAVERVPLHTGSAARPDIIMCSRARVRRVEQHHSAPDAARLEAGLSEGNPSVAVSAACRGVHSWALLVAGFYGLDRGFLGAGSMRVGVVITRVIECYDHVEDDV